MRILCTKSRLLVIATNLIAGNPHIFPPRHIKIVLSQYPVLIHVYFSTSASIYLLEFEKHIGISPYNLYVMLFDESPIQRNEFMIA